MNVLTDEPGRATKPLTLVQYEAASALRQPLSLAPVLAALWLITCAPVVAHGQDSTSRTAPAGTEQTAPVATDRAGMRLSDALPLTSASPAPSHTKDSSML